MKVAQLTIHLTTIPMKSPFQMSGTVIARRENVVVALTTEDGITGWGETQPTPGFAGYTRAMAASVIREYLGPAVLGLDVRNLGVLSYRLDHALPFNPYAKAAVLDAAFDALARVYGVPLNSLLGGPLREEVPCAWVLGIQDTLSMVREAEWAVGQGYRTLKLKVGAHPEDDLTHIGAVRKAVGEGVKIRLDANEGYSLARAIPTMRQAAIYNIEAVEQPTAAWDLRALRQVHEATGIPVMVDEGVKSATDLLLVARSRAAHIVNIKPPKIGGVYRARQWLDLALVAGLEPSFSTSLASTLGVAAVGALALSSPLLSYAVEFHLGPLLMAGDLVEAPMIPRNGALFQSEILGDGMGIGRVPDVELLGRYSEHREVLR